MPARYKGVYGGRGSGKSHFFGELLVETCQAERGTLAVCIREAQRTLAQSSKRLIESKISTLGLGHGFKVYSDKIATPGDGILIFRGMQAATAKYRDDIAGAIVTSGTSTAYTVSTFQIFDTLAHLNGQMIAFTPHATNGSTATLNADGLGAKPLRASPGVDLQAGVIIQGTPYVAVYNNVDGAFYLRGFMGNPYNIPLAGGLDYWAATAPNTSFAFPIGQAISRSTYSALFALIGTAYGSGDGSTTFNLPDKKGRVSAALDNMGGVSAGRLTSASSGFGAQGQSPTTLGGAGGSENHLLTIGEIPAHTHLNTLNDPGHSHTYTAPIYDANDTRLFDAHPRFDGTQTLTSSTNTTGITLTNASQGGGAAHAIVQPTIVCNYIIRII
jgi:microcystin-dependent protein